MLLFTQTEQFSAKPAPDLIYYITYGVSSSAVAGPGPKYEAVAMTTSGGPSLGIFDTYLEAVAACQADADKRLGV